MTQTELGAALGLTFQQIQKYERGTNRISASKLVMLADALRVPVGAFFEGCEAAANDEQPDEIKALVKHFDDMPEDIRMDFLRMIRSIATASY
jgi:transcriptional regulator with XRE-family HTH domain